MTGSKETKGRDKGKRRSKEMEGRDEAKRWREVWKSEAM